MPSPGFTICSSLMSQVVTRNLNKIIDVNYYPVPEVINLFPSPFPLLSHLHTSFSPLTPPHTPYPLSHFHTPLIPLTPHTPLIPSHTHTPLISSHSTHPYPLTHPHALIPSHIPHPPYHLHRPSTPTRGTVPLGLASRGWPTPSSSCGSLLTVPRPKI